MRLRWGLSALLLFSTLCFAEQPDRIAGAIGSSEAVVLAGNVPAQAQPQYDQGAVESSFELPCITMLLQPSTSQQAALQRLLAQQQDRSSPNYHKWLTPEQYADRFGVSPNDVEKIATWLRAQGFGIVQSAHGRDWIAFRGTAALVETTFRTQIHYYNVAGELHFANATPLSIPKALAGIVVGFRGLHDFSLHPMGIRPISALDRFLADIVHPFYNAGFGHALAPGDVATIYDIQPLYNAGTNGSGQKLVVVGQTDIKMADIEDFRANFGLPKNDPQVILVPGSPDPGISTNDEGEADLDLEWSGAVARNATITYVNSSTKVGGVFNSASYAIDQNLAPVISMSYGGCEQDNADFIPSNEPTMQKASSEGITFLAASGDSGAAACDSDQGDSATLGLAVNYPASSPEATGVGGNEFNGDLNDPSKYWGDSNGTNGGSALSYIPETGWNDTSEAGTLSASGGGASSCDSPGCAQGFPKPSWQTGTGVPKDGVRDVPDVAMAASAYHDGYLFCSADGGVNCANGINTSETVGGTSASTPVFAGIVVLLNQELGSNPPGVGNVNPNLYTLAQDASNGIFHDITTGNNKVPCTEGTKDCPNGGSIGYSAGTGYDQVTGLGSVDANNLVTRFTTAPTTTTLASSLNPAGSGVAVTFTATVTGTNSPTGTVTFYDGSTQIGTPQTLSSGVATLQISNLSVGGHSITAAYGGDKKNAPSSSAVLTETILGTGTTPLTSFVIVANQGPVGYGTPVTFTATVAPAAATGTVTFIADGATPLGFANLNAGVASSPSFLLSVGEHPIQGLYSGDGTYQSGYSPAIVQVITKASTTTTASLAPTAVNVKSSGPIVLSAAITPSSGPTGTVSFLVDGTIVGQRSVGTGFSYNPSSLAAGIHSVAASYSGDTNFNGSTSAAVNLNVEDFKIAASPTTVNISAPGQSGTTTLTITPLGGFNQTLTYSCSGLPEMASCGFTAVSATSVTVTIDTLAAAGLRKKAFGHGMGILYAMLLPGLLILPAGACQRSRRPVLLLLGPLMMLLLLMPGCGGGSSSGGGGSGGSSSSSTVTIMASTLGATGSLSHSVNITLNVQ